MDVEAINTLLKKKVTRKEFLIHIGFIIIAVMGISGIIKSITYPHYRKESAHSSGFGTGPYGGTGKEKV